MSIRHYIVVEKDGKEVFSEQVIGNNDFFDEKFYEDLGIDMEDFNDFLKPTPIDMQKFFVCYKEWLDRNPEKKGLGASFRKTERYAELIYLDYACGNYYDLEPYMLARDMQEYLNFRGETEKGYKIFLTIA